MKRRILGLLFVTLVLVITLAVGGIANHLAAQTEQESGAVGVEGTVAAASPTSAPTITTPINGQVFTKLPITVAGLCQNGLLVEVFKNGVFAGSVQCAGGSYSLLIDLFSGQNDLVARQFDNLNQASPDSNTVSVTFNDSLPGSGPRVSLITAYAKRGAVPGDTLSWPITISGGTPPFAISVDWGDKSTPDLLSRDSTGDILLQHIYDQSGIYNITIKASDSNGQTAFLQVVGIGNGPIQQTGATARPTAPSGAISNRILFIALAVALLMLFISFWLGRKHQLQVIRTRIRKGLRPF